MRAAAGQKLFNLVESYYNNMSRSTRSTRGGPKSYKKGFRRTTIRRGRAGTMPRKVKGLSRQVRELKRLAEADMGTHIHRRRDVNAILSLENEQNVNYIVSCNVERLEEVLLQLRYYDPSNPGTLLVASGVSGTFQKDFFFSRIHSKITVRNNYQVPCEVRIYQCVPKDDTSIDVVSAFQDGLTDVGNPGYLSPLTYLTDSKLFDDLWRIKQSAIKLLDAGRQCSMTWSAKPFQYDPSLTDSHNQQYQAAFQASVFMVFIKGVVSHDALADQQGTSSAGIDMMCDTVYEVKYPAGADITQFTVDDGSSAFANGARLTNKPAADVQAQARA